MADLDGDIDMDVEGERAVVSVVGTSLSALVGRNGEVLEALQELTRMAVQRRPASAAGSCSTSAVTGRGRARPGAN